MTFVVRLSFITPALAAIFVAATGAGCVASDPGAPDESTTSQGVCTQVAHAGGVTANSSCSYPWVGQQGRLLQGQTNPEVRYAVPTDPNVRATVDSTGHISVVDANNAALGDNYLLTQPFTATGSDGTLSSLQVTAIYPPNADPADPNYGRYQYVVTQAGGAPLCDDPPTVLPPLLPLATPIRAIAERGAWASVGIYFPSATGISFACRTGVIAKCDRWSYGPDTTWPTTTAHGRSLFVTGADVHNTCTRMARADYCSQGLPNTLDGTPIYIEDNFHLRVPQPGYVPEAAWRDVAWDDRGTPGKPVVCLSKLRWSTLPIGGDCPLTVPDPRETAKAKFCDDMTDAQLDAAGTILFSSSAFIDAGLNTFFDPHTRQHLTTTALQPQAYPLPAAWTSPPPAGVGFPISNPPANDPRFEATLLAPTLPEGFDTTGLVMLGSYLCGTELITTATPPAGCTTIAKEGYLYPPNAPGRAPLRRWRDRATGHAWTTVTSPTTMWPQRAMITEVIGGVVRAALDVNVRWTAVPSTTYALDIQLRTGEWIASCLGSATLGSATTAVYSGTCPDAAGRSVNHNDIVAFRMNYGGHYVVQPYDGVSSDVYIPSIGAAPPLTISQVKHALISALTVKWNDLGRSVYTVTVAGNDGVAHNCAPFELLANDTSYVHTGTCPSNYAVAASAVVTVEVCAFDASTHAKRTCGEAKLDGKTATVSLLFKQ